MIRPHAYILAGGRSRRFGSDKAWAQLNGVPLIAHVALAVKSVAGRVTVVADTPDKFSPLGLRTIADQTPHRGPLGGLAAAIGDHASDDPLLLTACDLVLADVAVLDSLLRQWRPGDRALAMRDPMGWRPFPGLYHPKLESVVQNILVHGDGSLRALLERCGRAIAPAAHADAVDCNTPESLEEAKRLLMDPCAGSRGHNAGASC
ncbi:MAG: molybdenum cofactor guanylyltransferase [Planctomycetota bacterium]|nr:MAG: molybdenum cofactor guanylyltransferase [Planctomycetota bacterium]